MRRWRQPCLKQWQSQCWLDWHIRPCILKPGVAARRATRHHLCSSSVTSAAVHCMSVFACVVPPFPGPYVVILSALLATVGRCRWSGGARGRAHDWAAAALRFHTAALVTTVCARTAWRHRCSGASHRALAGKRDSPRDERCGLLRWARERERGHGACNERRAKEAAPHLLRRPHFPSTLFTGLSDSSASRWLDFMSCSVALEVMPHSATSRATGDDTSTIRTWNSGV